MGAARFITIEGIEGSGKTTILAYLQQLLVSAGHQVVVTREPGGTTLGEEVRTLLISHREEGMEVNAELLLIFAARAEHLLRVIRPALAAGKLVFCDRFTDATYAYQGGGRGISVDRIATLESWIQDNLYPHLTLLLDVPIEIGMARIKKRAVMDRFEREASIFHQRVREVYLARAAAYPQRFRVVDASRPLIEVQASVARMIGEFL